MYKNRVVSAIAVSLLFLSVGCDKLCKKTVQDFANVQNMTGRPLTLSVCKGRVYGEVEAEIEMSGISQEIDLGSREASEVKGGPTGSCNDVSDSKTQMGITLSPNSFGQVKLCYNESTHLNLVVEAYQTCPSGYLEQISAVPCN
jgi:hypothetical protein